MLEWAGVALLIACAILIPCAAGTGNSKTVDIFNVSSAPPATTSAAPATSIAPPATTSAAPATSIAPNPPSSAPPATSIPPPSTGSLCTSDCGSCCCPGCHAINGTCYLCPAGSFSSDCLDHVQSSCRACPSGFFCPQGAVQPYLPSTTIAAIVVCVVVAHLVLACIFCRAKRLTWTKSKPWIVVALVFGPLAWLLWWLRHRAVGRPQASETMHQSLVGAVSRL
jgi:hypothetical protein